MVIMNSSNGMQTPYWKPCIIYNMAFSIGLCVLLYSEFVPTVILPMPVYACLVQ